jgi:hypothetical protein
LQLRGAQAEVAETESKAALNLAKARDIELAHATSSSDVNMRLARKPPEQCERRNGAHYVD